MHDPSDGFSKTSVRDQAALLLSIADIAKSEMKSGDRMLWKGDEELPKLPLLLGSAFSLRDKTPREHRSSSLNSMLISAPPVSTYTSSRARTVSLDLVEQSRMGGNRTPSPLTMTEGQQVPVTPSPMIRKGLRVSTRKRKQPELEELEEDEDEFDALADNRKSSGPLQGTVPKGVSAKKIHRRKFSWKNYPEVSPLCIYRRGCMIETQTHYSIAAGTVSHYESRGIPSALGYELHDPTETVQQPFDGKAAGTRNRAWLHF